MSQGETSLKRQPALFNLAATMMAALFATAMPSYGQFLPTPSALTFSASVGANPPSQFVTVNSSPFGVGFNASATANSGGNWLSVVPTFGTTVGQVEVRITSNTLPAGTYSGQVTISGGTLAAVNVPVTLTVGGGGGGGGTGTFTANPQSLSFSYDVGGAFPGGQAITVSSTQALTYTATASTSTGFGWLTVSPNQTGATTITQFTVSVSPSGLTAGSYNGQISITGGGQTANIPVFLTVTQGGGGGSGGPITVLPSSVSISAAVGQTTPTISSLTVTSTFPSTFQVVPTTTTGGNWLSVNPTNSNTGTTVSVSANPTGLFAGTYNGNLAVVVAGVGTVNVPVAFTVGSGGGGGTGIFTTSPQSFNFSHQLGSNPPGGQVLSVSSSQQLTYTASATTSTGFGWLTVSPNFAGPTSFANFTVSVSPTFLTAGTYSGQVSITGGGSTVNVPVTITVSTQGGGTGPVTVTPGSLSVNATAGQTTTIVNSLTITSTTASTFSITPTTSNGGNWLAAIPASGNTGTTVQITTNPAGLPNGTYSGNLSVVVNGVGTANVPVTMTVGTGGGGTGSLVLTPTTLSFSSATGIAPQPQLVQVNSTTTTNFTASASTTSGGNWLTVFQSSFFTPGTITVSVNPSSLTPFTTYFGSIQIAAAGGAIQSIPVTFAYGTGGGGGGGGGGTCLAGTYNPTSLTFNYTTGGVIPQAQAFQLTTPGPQSFTLSSAVPGNWLSVFPPSGTTTPTSNITVNVQPTGLPAGTYNGNLTFTFTSSGQQCAYPVTLIVSGGGGGGTGGVSATPSTVNFNYQPGGVLPANQTINLSTPSPAQFSASIQYQAGQQQNWLFAGPVSGATVGTPGSAGIQLGVVPTNLPLGLYNATVLISVSGQTLSVPVTLNVGNAPTATLAPSQVNFSYQTGTSIPGPQLVSINTLNGVSAPFTANATTNQGSGWLSVSPTSAQAPGVIAITVNPQALAPGSYSGTVNVSISGSQVPITLPVTLTVSSAPVLRLSPTNATFNYQVGGSVPAGQGQNVEVTSSGSPVQFSVASQVSTPFGGSWLSVSQNSSTTPATVSIQINASNLSAGTYAGTVSFTAANQAPLTIPVTVNVSSNALFNAAPPQLNFSSPVNGTTNPQNLSITTTGQALQFQPTVVTMNGGTQWLQVSPGNFGQTPANLQVTTQPAGLPEGTYFGAVVITSAQQGTAANSPLIIPVVLTVGSGGGGTGGTALSITPTSLTFTQIFGGGTPQAQTLNIGSTGNLLGYTLNTSTLNGGSWLSVSPTTGTTPGTAQVQVSAASLALGSYSGSVIVTANGASNTPQVVPITLNVITAPVVTASPTSLTFNATSAAGNPAAQTITVQSSGSPITFSTSASVSSGGVQWLSVTPQTGSTPGTVTVNVNTSGLQSGTFNGTVTINTGLLTPITIPVTLNFNTSGASPTINAVTNAANFQPTAVTPGMIVAIFGSNLGPDTLVGLRLTAGGTVDTTLSTVRVLFDGIAAPLVYVRRDVVSAVVPYEIGGRATTNVQVEYQGARGPAVSLRVIDASPGIFTTNQQGNGQGAIQNSDFSLNGPGNAAARGSFATMYITGEGALNPAGASGTIATASQLRRVVAPVQVRVGGRDAQVIFAGAVPTVVLGLAQVSFFIPNDAPTGANVAVEVIVGGVASQGGITMAVR
jgi:uncharacterized protein (TIGR03437 family)